MIKFEIKNEPFMLYFQKSQLFLKKSMNRNYGQTIKEEYEAIFSDLIQSFVEYAKLIEDPYIRLSILNKTLVLQNIYGSDNLILNLLHEEISSLKKDITKL